jgi:hypothetical protein
MRAGRPLARSNQAIRRAEPNWIKSNGRREATGHFQFPPPSWSLFAREEGRWRHSDDDDDDGSGRRQHGLAELEVVWNWAKLGRRRGSCAISARRRTPNERGGPMSER